MKIVSIPHRIRSLGGILEGQVLERLLICSLPY